MHKKFLIAVSKSDLLDEELKQAIEEELPRNIPHVFFSSIMQTGLEVLKDMLWKALNEN
jgi:GTP-binding protein